MIVVVLACVASWMLYLHRYAWGVLTAVEGEDRLGGSMSPRQLGSLDAGFSLSYGAGQIPGGWIADWYGPRLVLSLSVATWSASLAAFIFVAGFWPLMAMRIVFGLAQAAAFPCLSKITRAWFSPAVRTTVQGLVASMSARAGGACASLIIATLLWGVLGMGWRESLAVLAAAGVVYAGVFAIFFRNSPAEHPWTAGERFEIAPATTAETTFLWDRGNIINLGVFLVHAFASAFADNWFVFWTARFLVDEHRLQPIEMGIYASLPLIGGAIGGVSGGALNDMLIRLTGRRRFARSAIAIVGKGMAAILIFSGMLLDNPFAAMLGLGACKFFSDWSQASLWGTVTDIAGPASGRVFGVVNSAGIVGAFVAGFAMGAVRQDFGWNALFVVVSVAYVVAALCWFVIDCTRPLVNAEANRAA